MRYIELTTSYHEKIFLNINAIESFSSCMGGSIRCTRIITISDHAESYIVLESVDDVLRLIEKAVQNG